MKYERGAEDLPVDTNMSTGSPSATATHVAREDCPHLADPEWEALKRLSTVIGEAAVATILRTLSPTEQHGVTLGFIMKEQREIAARATVSTPSTQRVESLKPHVNSYVGREGEPLLRWLVEVDTAITARPIVDPLSKVAFAMPCLGGRAWSWAYERRLTDPTCFSTYEVFKEELRQAFESPQNEFRSRAKFLDLQQGKHDVHAYAQRPRYLVSNIVTNPIDEAPKVVTFMKGLKDGPVKTYLFRDWKRFARNLNDGRIKQICILSDVKTMKSDAGELKHLVDEGADARSTKSKKERFDEQSWDSLESSPSTRSCASTRTYSRTTFLRSCRRNIGIQHEIDLVPGTNAPTFCIKKAQGEWRIVHAYNKLNDATVPAQTPTPQKDVIIDSMALSTIFSALDLRDGFYQFLMRESDIPLTAVSTPSGTLWEWLVMPQGLMNAPATFHRCVTHLLRSVHDLAPSYFDDVFIHSRAVNGKSEVEMHKEQLFPLMRKHKLYANLKKRIFGASEIPVLECLVGKDGVRPDPGKVRVINEWPTPSNVKERRQLLGLATYLCKYVGNYAGKMRPLSQLLKKDDAWDGTAECQQTFDAVKQGLTEAPILAVADQDRPFHVVCDATDFAIGCALMQHDHEGRDRVVYYQSRQLKPAERNYPVEYKPGRLNVVADALSHQPDYDVHKTDANAIGVVRSSTPSSSLLDVRSAYANDADAKQLLDYFAAPPDKSRQKLAKHLRARVHRYRVHNGLLLYSAVDDNADRVVVPDDHELKLRITYEYHNAPTSGHPGREKTYLLLPRDFYWRHQYKWVRKYVRACEVCQRVKPAPFSQAPLQSLPTPSAC
ncbi:unnamed protein product [Phytophthora fragariaefolia]|uniref:Unnamed protein product n=1 Tax=Phytophthora fragariaefolia TaxID=1490495 RepID=A0A9W6TZR4_9STRA|nr:unnamed protein product [Phytophthora fragariaefolia]